MPKPLWWLLFTVVGIWLQHFLPGVDLLVPGLIVCLQEDGPAPALWLSAPWILIQEGTGSLHFGVGVLWYAGLWVLFYAGRLLLESRSGVFVILFAFFSGCYHFFLVQIFSRLQGLEVPLALQMQDSLRHIFLFPLVWLVVSFLYRGREAGHA
ncbi:hypothetical protein [Desulfohalobium retbaense]|uniref:Rod shape-determining protein MreD n=1 Tax=Desulfohalobium retbaense (strain ATCC 49708 / DSM 5692 / JCM 16813 / HR100) TaxID=485915 RepID=C8X507_DESRD|nr:hypothetical protein [Desulfohalobium retbaense]ACV69504.1 conserved hypothetical protein [Desulfohalobium retbaense DSM 5692]